MIQRISDTTSDSRLLTGDYGAVREVKQDVHVVVEWERGFVAEIHPFVLYTISDLGAGRRGRP